MDEIVILTPDPRDTSFAGQWPQVLERLSASLAAGGLRTRASPWTEHAADAGQLAGSPLVLPLLAWGYHRDPERWLRACATWRNAGVRLLNPPTVLAWNSDKSYLRRLGSSGVAIPPTFWSDHITQAQIDQAFADTQAEALVVKPRISGGAWRTSRLIRGERLEGGPDGPALIQPYLASIETEGETSLLFFGGRFSHAVNKRPQEGDFRIQVQFGGRYAALAEPPSAALALAERALEAIGEDLLYARIDLARGADDEWLLMEAELIEPDFYLGQAPDGGKRFTRAVLNRLGAQIPEV
jgi:glutathione synthase/RimK-type ligase-like ATP-grasp enzyme